VDAVRAAAELADHVVVTIHWGRELEACPADHQHDLADALVEAGADVVAGHHAHRLQGLEVRADAVVAYGLGNLVFYASSEQARTTALLRVTLDGAGPPEPEVLPARIDREGSPQPLTGGAAEAVREEMADLAPGAGACPEA
jgi:poly-gamma-glutamate synthesis protein (capsule biosynthesis protein)